jgi:dolichol-phosphate mannosyltransferase
MKPLVILPTYNEKDSLPVVLIKILDQEEFDILIVDDSSTDGTTELAKHWVERDNRVHLLQRPAKLGLGTAYIAGFKWGLERDYDCFLEMDADLSHDPLTLPTFIEKIESGADLVIGARYLGGTISVVGWDFKRLLLSRFGNLYASILLRTRLCDMTSGFRAFSRKALEALDLDAIRSEGYSFQIEMAYRVLRKGMNVSEIKIVFTERTHGKSKMSQTIVREAMALPWKLRLEELIKRIKGTVPDLNEPPDEQSAGKTH